MPIENPVIKTEDPASGAYDDMTQAPLVGLIARLWKTVVIIGGLLLLIYLVFGAFEWITAGGDKEKVKQARQRIMNGIIGMAILTASFAIMTFLKVLFGFDLLNIVWPTPQGG